MQATNLIHRFPLRVVLSVSESFCACASFKEITYCCYKTAGLPRRGKENKRWHQNTACPILLDLFVTYSIISENRDSLAEVATPPLAAGSCKAGGGASCAAGRSSAWTNSSQSELQRGASVVGTTGATGATGAGAGAGAGTAVAGTSPGPRPPSASEPRVVAIATSLMLPSGRSAEAPSSSPPPPRRCSPVPAAKKPLFVPPLPPPPPSTGDDLARGRVEKRDRSQFRIFAAGGAGPSSSSGGEEALLPSTGLWILSCVAGVAGVASVAGAAGVAGVASVAGLMAAVAAAAAPAPAPASAPASGAGWRSSSEALLVESTATGLAASLDFRFSSLAWRFFSALAAFSSSFFAFASSLASTRFSRSSSFS